jgi:hypothetical protein
MTQLSNYLSKVKSYCDFYLELDFTNKRYKFNGNYADEIKCETFEYQIEQFKDELYFLLDDIKEKDRLIKNIINILEPNLSWFTTEKIYDFSSFNKLNSNVITKGKSKILPEKIKPSIVKIEGNEIAKSTYKPLQTILDSPEKLNDNEDELFYYLIMHKTKTNNYKDKLDFEKVKLHFVLKKYFITLNSFRQELTNLYDNIITYGIEDFNSFRPFKKPKQRCVVNLEKIEVATLFDAFFKSKLFYFDLRSDKKIDKAKYDFINNNFSYRDRKNNIVPLTNIYKEFGYISAYSHRDRQKKIIDELIDTLREVKTKL